MSECDRPDGEGDDDWPRGDDRPRAEWPVELRGVTESVVATLGPNDRWNFAALGLHATEPAETPDSTASEVGDDDRRKRPKITATTWGNTRTRRNFHRRGGGVVQFTPDPRDFVASALTIFEGDDPVLDSADAWAEVEVECVADGESDGTRWERWELTPVSAAVVCERVPTINRGFAAVVDATVAASRLDVGTYDTETLLDRLDYCAETVEKCGGPLEREAFATLTDVTGWPEMRE